MPVIFMGHGNPMGSLPSFALYPGYEKKEGSAPFPDRGI